MSKPYSSPSDKVSVLGPTLVFKGELTAEEDLTLEGRVEGAITHAGSLTISKEGSVKGNIKAKNIVVQGKVEGDLFGGESVAVQESAKIVGNIYSRRVSLIEGARFKGTIDMDAAGAAAAEPPRAKHPEPSEQSAPQTPKVAAAAK